MNDAERLAEDIRLVENIRWKSDDRDNMEFLARASCYQREALNRLLLRISSTPTASDDAELIALLRSGQWDHVVIQGPNPTGFVTADHPAPKQAADRLEALSSTPSEAMVEAGAAALYGVSDFEGQWPELTDMSKAVFREKAEAVLTAAMQAKGDEG